MPHNCWDVGATCIVQLLVYLSVESHIIRAQGSKPGTPDAGKTFTGFPRHNFAFNIKKGPWGLKTV
jgi:hypothetical protein